jgi:hypothetical protein
MATLPCTKGQCTFVFDADTNAWDKLAGCTGSCDCAQNPNDIGQPGNDGDIFITPCVMPRVAAPAKKPAQAKPTIPK